MTAVETLIDDFYVLQADLATRATAPDLAMLVVAGRQLRQALG